MQHLPNLINSKYPRQLLPQFVNLVDFSYRQMRKGVAYTLILVTNVHGIRLLRHFVRDRRKFVPD